MNVLEKRRIIAETTAQLLLQEGGCQVSMAAVSHLSHTSTATMYKLFASKDDIVLSGVKVILRSFDQFGEPADTVMAANRDSWSEFCRHVLNYFKALASVEAGFIWRNWALCLSAKEQSVFDYGEAVLLEALAFCVQEQLIAKDRQADVLDLICGYGERKLILAFEQGQVPTVEQAESVALQVLDLVAPMFDLKGSKKVAA